MSLNYDPKLNRMREFRFKGVDYQQLLQARPQDVLNPQQYGTLYKETQIGLMNEACLLSSSIVGQFLLGRSRPFKQLNGYIRATTRVGIISLPWFLMRQANAKYLNKLYDDMLLQLLNSTYEQPISFKYKPNI